LRTASSDGIVADLADLPNHLHYLVHLHLARFYGFIKAAGLQQQQQLCLQRFEQCCLGGFG
jgi:hypothetical protein